MAEREGSSIFVAVPVYRGTRFVAETLRSILGQTHRNLRVMISVDGNDRDSAATCAPFLSDGRVRMVVQDRQLGFVANLNWLIDACDGDYYCYWQQDDLCAPDYLEKLLAAIADHPDAACAYSDLRWFGRQSRDVVMPAIVGSTRQRILAQIEGLHWIPLRALVPMEVLRRVGPIRGLDGGIVFADYLWVLRLAAAGHLVRVPEVLYLKRDHEDSASHTTSISNPYSARESWIRLGLMMYAEVASLFEPADRAKLATVIADRLVMRHPGRWFLYDAAAVSVAEPADVAMAFFRALEAQSGVRPPITVADDGSEESLRTLRLQRDHAPEGTALRVVADAALLAPERRACVRAAMADGALHLSCTADGAAFVLLLDGWSQPEDWGTWSDGIRARLWIPLPGDRGRWGVNLVGRPYRGTREARATPRITVFLDDTVLVDCHPVADSVVLAFELTGDPAAEEGVVVRVDMPNAISPAALGLGADERSLAFGLERVELTRISAPH